MISFASSDNSAGGVRTRLHELENDSVRVTEVHPQLAVPIRVRRRQKMDAVGTEGLIGGVDVAHDKRQVSGSDPRVVGGALGRLLAIGITSSITLQAIVNIAVTTGIIPVTGITLPFISYGGTSLVITLAMVGILLSISRDRGQLEEDDEFAEEFGH